MVWRIDMDYSALDRIKGEVGQCLDRAFDMGFTQGYEKGLEDEYKDDAYKRGLEDSWELAKELNNSNSQIPYEIFGLKNENGAYASPLNWDQMITVHEVRERVKEWLDKRRKDVKASGAFREIADGLLSLVMKGYKKDEIAAVLEAMQD